MKFKNTFFPNSEIKILDDFCPFLQNSPIFQTILRGRNFKAMSFVFWIIAFYIRVKLLWKYVVSIRIKYTQYSFTQADPQTWKKLIFVCKPIIGFEKCLQIQIVLKHIKLLKMAIFKSYQIFSSKNELIVDNNADLSTLMGEICNKIVG